MRKWFPGRTLARLNELNVEKLVLALALVWFAATGLDLLRPPSVPEWGPPRTFDAAPPVPGDLRHPRALPTGGRDDLFSWPGSRKEPEARRRREQELERRRRELEEERRQAEEKDQDDTREPEERGPSEKSEEGGGREPIVRVRAVPRFVGTLSVEESGTYTFVAEGDEYVVVTPGGGESARYALVESAADHLLLKDRGNRLIRVPIPSRTP